MNLLNRRAFCIASSAAAGALALATPSAQAQTPPLDVARILIGFPAGSGADAMARALAQRLAPAYAKQVIVENRTGHRRRRSRHSTRRSGRAWPILRSRK